MTDSNSSVFFFFFQAEDGIRDLTVTGVQTYALPISLGLGWAAGRAVGQANAVTTRPASTAPEQINRDLIMSVYLATPAFGDIRDAMQIGRASCRERV